MSLPDDLLKLASKMVNYKKSDVLDARLRRGVSTAYYALFHLLLEHASAIIATHANVQQLVSRAYTHGDMYKAAKSFASGMGGLPKQITTALGGAIDSIPGDLIVVAKTFVILQEARHEADYDRSKVFARAEAQELVSNAARTFRTWNSFRTNPANAELCQLFLASLLLTERWKK